MPYRSHGVEEFKKLCAERGLSVTHQRQVIYDALMGMRDHPSPEAIYEKVRRQIPSISLGTIYKNIKTFVDSGLLREVSLHHGSARLETNLEPHHHLVCLRCKTIVDLDDDDVEPVRLKSDVPGGFRVQRYSVEVIGLCQDCAAE
ncbi:MAG TPA: transcriptional repressor [Bryobacteraceae bacterium]|nr:transcriptional repressor [Bryobacteraceae bacterium]